MPPDHTTPFHQVLYKRSMHPIPVQQIHCHGSSGNIELPIDITEWQHTASYKCHGILYRHCNIYWQNFQQVDPMPVASHSWTWGTQQFTLHNSDSALSLKGEMSCKVRGMCKLPQLENYELSLMQKLKLSDVMILVVSKSIFWQLAVSTSSDCTDRCCGIHRIFSWHLWIFADPFEYLSCKKICFLTPRIFVSFCSQWESLVIGIQTWYIWYPKAKWTPWHMSLAPQLKNQCGESSSERYQGMF